MTVAKRARQDWQKEQRAEAILNAAQELFEESGGQIAAVSDVASRASIAKGTVYLYYDTKEEIYFALMQRHMSDWIDEVIKALESDTEDLNADRLADHFCKPAFERLGMLELASLSHAVIEQNISEAAYLRYVEVFAQILEDLDAILAQKIVGIDMKIGSELCMQSYALLIGLWQIHSPPEIATQALKAEKLQIFNADFQRQAKLGIKALWVSAFPTVAPE